MASIRDVITDAKVESLHAVVESGGNKYLCFTRLGSEGWILNVSDGYDLWRQEFDLDELDAHRDLAEVNTLDAYLARFRNGFLTSDLLVTQSGIKLNLRVGQGTTTLNFDLYEAKAIEKKSELQHVLFRLAEKATELESQLEKTTQSLETLKAQKGKTGAGDGNIFDVDGSKKKGQPKAQPKQAGMSVINPGSKKRKTPRGVQFD